MSDDFFAMLRRVLRSPLQPNERLVLVVLLAHWSRDSPVPFVGHGTLVRETGLAKSAVQAALRGLRAAGALNWTTAKSRPGAQASNHYDLTAICTLPDAPRPRKGAGTAPGIPPHGIPPHGIPGDGRGYTASRYTGVPPGGTDQSSDQSNDHSRAVAPTSKNGIQIQVGVSSPSTKKAKPRGSRFVPDDWQPSDSHRDKAAELGVFVADEARKFREWEFKSPKTNFDLAFHRWLNNATPRQRHEPNETLASRFAGYEIG